ncbi:MULTISPECIES: DUF5309 family protein [unclassified Variovorax]|uniref:SU10 major capsid protein n=1 Tax=unclassified Variovorax TaxID=663243 RepID=UPI00076C37DE|nr:MULTISPECIES: DUF5309 family protein [unclassified Variovorax]KWT94681.1 hypothetical protein APY03_2556 [Variovorax sp. WDL1]PNG53180.1 hypothetical protein CHC06_04525 [Variovorax sp. B2]PNG53752.1 hypothetical protein CHC07_03572 [Variovorax sp. B4]VTV11203.1 hypothetical protein WDL1CHR_02086 [Variovorax sp. WDL1]
MAQPANLFDRYDVNNSVREDLVDKIYNVDPEDVPITTNFGRGTATNTLHEWQRDALAAANKDNAAIDGDDFAAEALTGTDRVGNYCQIFTKRPAVSRRANVVKKAGQSKSMAYQKAKKMKEIKRDIEAMVLSSNAAVAGSSSVASKSGGLGVLIYSNVSHGAGGSTTAHTSGAPLTAPVAGTARTFTEALLKTVAQAAYTASGQVPPQAVMSPSHKVTFSGFTGIAVNRYQVGKKEQGRIVGGADVYMSDFGEIEIVPHYIMQGSSTVFLVNPEHGELSFLDGFRTEEMGKTGDSEKVLVTADVTLTVDAEKAMGKIADLTP